MLSSFGTAFGVAGAAGLLGVAALLAAVLLGELVPALSFWLLVLGTSMVGGVGGWIGRIGSTGVAARG